VKGVISRVDWLLSCEAEEHLTFWGVPDPSPCHHCLGAASKRAMLGAREGFGEGGNNYAI
jgi:hypothetical protein